MQSASWARARRMMQAVLLHRGRSPVGAPDVTCIEDQDIRKVRLDIALVAPPDAETIPDVDGGERCARRR